jgi:hypothetical protein
MSLMKPLKRMFTLNEDYLDHTFGTKKMDEKTKNIKLRLKVNNSIENIYKLS